MQTGGVEAVGGVRDFSAPAQPHLHLRLPNCRSSDSDSQFRYLPISVQRERALRVALDRDGPRCLARGLRAVEIDELTNLSRQRAKIEVATDRQFFLSSRCLDLAEL